MLCGIQIRVCNTAVSYVYDGEKEAVMDIRIRIFGPPGSVSQRYGSGSFPFLIKVLSVLK
jgi:hypothetical protein